MFFSFRNWFPQCLFRFVCKQELCLLCHPLTELAWPQPLSNIHSYSAEITELAQMLLKSVDPPQLALENQSAGWGCLNVMAGTLLSTLFQTQPSLTDTAGVGLCTWSCEKNDTGMVTGHLKPAQGRPLYLRSNRKFMVRTLEVPVWKATVLKLD